MITKIDQIANQNHLTMLKALLTYLPLEEQKRYCFLIKFLELRNITAYYRNPCLSNCQTDHPPSELSDILNDLKQYCDPSDAAMIDQLLNISVLIECMAVMNETDSSDASD